MADWYYTSDKQQQGPVSRAELGELADKGLLKRTDLVWQHGMSDWERADSQGLFAEALDIADVPHRKKRVRLAEEDAEERPRRRSSRRDDYDADEEYERSRRRRARRRAAGMPVGFKVGLIVGGVVLFLIVVGAGLFLVLPRGHAEVAAGLGNFPGILNPHDRRDT
jgi:hypothetical protein